MGDKAAAFERVSTNGQNEANQRPDINNYCDEQGYEITRRYSLRGKSAYKGKQHKAIESVVEDIRNGDVTVVVCWALDRWTREGITAYFALKSAVESAGGRIEYALEPSMSELEQAVKAHMAYEESKLKSERVRIGLAATRSNGGVTKRAPWGYRTEGAKRHKKYVPTDQGRALVPIAFAMIAENKSLADVQRWLAGEGVKISRAGVASLIRNPAYMGKVTDSNGAIVSTCESLVDAVVWTRANRALAGRERKRTGGQKNDKAMLSGGVLTCETCGAARWRTAADGKRTTRYYRCSGTPSCGGVATYKVDNAVTKIITTTCDTPVMIRTVVPGHNWESQIEEAQFELRALANRGLDWEAEDTERQRLRDEITRLRSLPSVPDREEWTPTGETYADVYTSLSEADRGQWLASHGFSVTASKTHVTVVQPLGDGLRMAL